MDKTIQIAEEQLVMTINKAHETKLQRHKKLAFGCFSADISKGEEISRWQLIGNALHCNFSATKKFFKNHNNFYQKDSRSFQQWVQQEAKRSILQDYEGTDTHTHTHTDYHHPLPMLGLNICT